MDAPGKKYVTKCPGAPRHTYMHAYIHAYIHTYIHAQPHIHTRMRTYTSNLARWLPQTFPCASRCWSPFRRPPKRRPPCFSFLFHQAARIFGLARRNETKCMFMFRLARRKEIMFIHTLIHKWMQTRITHKHATMHACIHTCLQTYTYTRAQSNIRAYTYIRTCTYILACIYTHIPLVLYPRKVVLTRALRSRALAL